MPETIPIEECAKQRLDVMVYAYTLFTKHLMEEGVDREKVKRASDKVWSKLGHQAAKQMKPFFGDQVNIETLQRAGAIAEEIHGMEVESTIQGNKVETEFKKCPWHDAFSTMGISEDWRFCSSGHDAFTKSMFKGLNPKASYELVDTMAAGAKVCKAVSRL